MRFISTISVTTCIVLVFTMIYLATYKIVTEGYAEGKEATPAVVTDIRGVIGGSAAICFAYSSIINVVSVYNDGNRNDGTLPSLPDANRSKLSKMIKVTMLWRLNSANFAIVGAVKDKYTPVATYLCFITTLERYTHT